MLAVQAPCNGVAHWIAPRPFRRRFGGWNLSSQHDSILSYFAERCGHVLHCRSIAERWPIARETDGLIDIGVVRRNSSSRSSCSVMVEQGGW